MTGPLTSQPANNDAHDMRSEWPLRPWLLAGLLAVGGLLISLVTDFGSSDEPWRMALAALVFFGTLTFAFTVDRARFAGPAIFAALVALAMFGLAWRVAAADMRAADEAFWFAAGVLAVLLAIPLFQSGFHQTRFATPYRETHFHVWTDAIGAAGALAFVSLSWALLAIIAALFELLNITIIEELIDEKWFGWMFSGAAFGAALGVLRNQLGVLATLQSVLMLVLSILAIPLAAALALFLVAMIISGPQVLWNATDSATPVLLACAVGAFVLANAVLRDSDADMRGNRFTRIAALVLALSIAPLAIFAAISMGVRVAQHGLSPERLWGLIAVGVAVVYGVGYAVNIIRGWRGGAWRDLVRQANLHMAVLVCGVAILLALPLFDFGAVSARSQVERLTDGDVAVEEFDFSALRWDFGDPGRAALRRLAQSDNEAIAEGAKIALAQETRSYRRSAEPDNDTADRLANLRLQIDDPELAERVRLRIAAQPWRCRDVCVALPIRKGASGASEIALVERGRTDRFMVDPGQPVPTDPAALEIEVAIEQPEEVVELTTSSEVEIREWTGRRIYVDGKPAGEPFE